MAVTVSDKYAPGKSSRFVGICIHRGGHGLDHKFILRNVVENQGTYCCSYYFIIRVYVNNTFFGVCPVS